MHRIPLGFLSLLTLGSFGSGMASADVARPKPVSGLGVASSLNINGVTFKKVDATAGSRQRTSFPATYSVSNFTGKPIPMQFASTGDAQAQIEFRLLNQAGATLWSTRPLLRAAGASLPRATAWRRTVQIPLVIDGTPLAAGRYTVEAEVLGRPRFLSQAQFDVTDPAPIVITPGTTPNHGLLYNVSTAKISFDEASGLIHLTAEGTVPTGGWSDALLRPRLPARAAGTAATPPADGIYDFEFVARPPSPLSAVTQAFVWFSTSLNFAAPPGFTGARVIAATSDLTATAGPGLTPSAVLLDDETTNGPRLFKITATAVDSGEDFVKLVPVYRLAKPLLEVLPGELPNRSAAAGVFDFRLFPFRFGQFVFPGTAPDQPPAISYVSDPTLRGVRVFGPATAVVTMLPGEAY